MVGLPCDRDRPYPQVSFLARLHPARGAGAGGTPHRSGVGAGFGLRLPDDSFLVQLIRHWIAPDR